MPRLLPWPNGLKFLSREPLSGPRTVGAGSSESLTGYVQTFAAPFGLWKWQFTFPNMAGKGWVRWRGTVTALHGGANGIIVPWYDPDGLTLAEAGNKASPAQQVYGLPWSNGRPWSSGQGWGPSRPMVPVARSSDKGNNVVPLATTGWGASLTIGMVIGFIPRHFGWYVITEVISPGVYRVWPPLRKAIGPEDYATLNPSIAMRMVGETGATLGRGRSFAQTPTVTLVGRRCPALLRVLTPTFSRART